MVLYLLRSIVLAGSICLVSAVVATPDTAALLQSSRHVSNNVSKHNASGNAHVRSAANDPLPYRCMVVVEACQQAPGWPASLTTWADTKEAFKVCCLSRHEQVTCNVLDEMFQPVIHQSFPHGASEEFCAGVEDLVHTHKMWEIATRKGGGSLRQTDALARIMKHVQQIQLHAPGLIQFLAAKTGEWGTAAAGAATVLALGQTGGAGSNAGSNAGALVAISAGLATHLTSCDPEAFDALSDEEQEEQIIREQCAHPDEIEALCLCERLGDCTAWNGDREGPDPDETDVFGNVIR